MQKKTVKRATPATRKTASSGKTAPPRKTASREAAARPKDIVAAGIRALGDAHEQVVARQGRVFESLLGLGTERADAARVASAHPSIAALDPFGFRKFEDVFDQRVARALLHLDVPTLEAIAAMKHEVERLHARIAALEAAAGKR